MTDPKTLIGKRFYMFECKYGRNIFEVRDASSGETGPFTLLRCSPVGWYGDGGVRDEVVWFYAHDVADAVRVQGEPEGRYPIAHPLYSLEPRMRARLNLMNGTHHGDGPCDEEGES